MKEYITQQFHTHKTIYFSSMHIKQFILVLQSDDFKTDKE